MHLGSMGRERCRKCFVFPCDGRTGEANEWRCFFLRDVRFDLLINGTSVLTAAINDDTSLGSLTEAKVPDDSRTWASVHTRFATSILMAILSFFCSLTAS